MKIGVVKRISKEDLKSKDLPAWIDQLLYPMNDFITKVVVALQGKLTFQDNFSASVLDKKFESGTELEINPQSGNIRVSGVLPLYAGGKTVTGFQWDYKSNGNIGVTFTFSGGGSANCKILVLLG